ncbi:MAG TPA: MFS transporter [Acidobacteriota bacterium]|nr:MFS transporter [Acidobacteriota bacterium]
MTVARREPNIGVDSSKTPRFFYGFIISIAAFFVLFSAYGVRFAYGVFFKPMAHELGFSAATTSAAYSISFFLEGVFSLVSGGLADRFGPRRVVSISCVLVGAGYFLMPLVHTVWQLYLFYGLIIGVGMGAMFVPLVSMTARWFSVRRNLMTGLVSSGAGAGMLIVPSSTAHLIDAYGWRTSFLISGVFVAIIVLVAAQFMKRDPEETGTVPYGESPRLPGTQSAPANGHSFREALRIPQFWTIFVMMFLFGIFAMSYNIHIVPDAINSGMPSTEAAQILATTGALLIAGRILMGILADGIGNRRIFILGFMIAFGAMLFISFVHTHWAFFVLAILMGIAQGGIGTSQSPVVASLFGLRSHGLILGCVGLGNTAGAAVGPLLTGYIFDLTKSYHVAFLICAASSLLALGFAFLIKHIDGSESTHRL